MSHAANEKAVYKQIAVDIAAKVVSGKYQPGQKIRGRSALASQYNVSPETVRRAVFLLSQVGVLEVRQGSGITILSVENAEEFLSKSGERESINTIKGHIGRLMQEQKQLNARLQENINILLDDARRGWRPVLCAPPHERALRMSMALSCSAPRPTFSRRGK